LKIINEDGLKNEEAAKIFSLHEDKEFQSAFTIIVRQAYTELFELHSDNAWTLEKGKLISFFRQTDRTSDIIGKRQASTFIAIAFVCGYGEVIPEKSVSPAKKGSKSRGIKNGEPKNNERITLPESNPIGKPINKTEYDANLTVRIEINLPVTDDQEVYNKIFKSIRENLLK